MGSLAARLPGCVDFSANCSLGDSRCSEGRWVDLSMEGGLPEEWDQGGRWLRS